MTNQEIVTKVARHLLRQRKKARENGRCRYRTKTGLRCAIGCLIPKRLYNPIIDDPVDAVLAGDFCESRGHDDPGEDKAFEIGRKIGLTYRNFRLLSSLQNIHDQRSPGDWREELQSLVRKHRLKWELKNE